MQPRSHEPPSLPGVSLSQTCQPGPGFPSRPFFPLPPFSWPFLSPFHFQSFASLLQHHNQFQPQFCANETNSKAPDSKRLAQGTTRTCRRDLRRLKGLKKGRLSAVLDFSNAKSLQSLVQIQNKNYKSKIEPNTQAPREQPASQLADIGCQFSLFRGREFQLRDLAEFLSNANRSRDQPEVRLSLNRQEVREDIGRARARARPDKLKSRGTL